MDNMIKY